MDSVVQFGQLHATGTNLLWCAIGTLLAIPVAIATALSAVQRLKVGAALGALIGAIAGYFITLFVWGVPLASIHLEGAVLLAATFFISAVTGIIGALLVNFLFAGSPPVRSSQVEF